MNAALVARILGVFLVVVGLGLMWLPLAFVAAGAAALIAGNELP